MGKKQRKQEKDIDDDQSVTSEDRHSDHSGHSAEPLSSPRGVDADDIHELIETLWGKQSTQSRVRALKNLAQFLQSLQNLDSFQERTETLLMYLQKLIKNKKSTAGERSGACHLVAIAASIFDSPSSETWSAICHDLIDAARDEAAPDAVRVSAVEALALCIVANPYSGEMDATEAQISAIAGIFDKNVTKANEQFVAAALRSFGLLVCVDPAKFFPLLQACEHRLLDLLQRQAAVVVIAAGEVLALLFELSRELGARRGLGMAPHLLEALAGEVGKIGKAQRQEIAPALRSVLAYVESEEEPSETMTVGGQKLEFASWKQLLLLSAYRNVLGPGLPIHLQFNPRVRALFDIQTVAMSPRAMTKAQKKAFQEETAAADKQRTIDRAKHTRHHLARQLEEED